MRAPILLRQASALLRVVAGHVSDDPVHFGMQVFRRLPPRASRLMSAALRRVPGPAAEASSAWLKGDVASAADFAVARPARGWQARFLGELAVSMGDPGTARMRANALAGTTAGARLSSRILWHEGRMSEAVAAAPPSAMRTRLSSELAVFRPEWDPSTAGNGAAPTPRSVPKASVLFALTNSLPVTQSGYTLRSHAVLTAVRDAGLGVLATNRTGYPTAVGRAVRCDRATVDGIPYLYDVPASLGRTPAARLDQQASFLRRAAEASGAAVLHTTTHFTNGLVARSVARDLELPWVYEVRGSLEDTWASARGGMEQDARNSERFQLFRAREAEVARSADAVVTLGHTMAAELVERGVDRERIVVAPNSVGSEVLSADWQAPASAVRAELGLPARGIWVGTAASVVGYEGLDVLVDAVRAARTSGVDIRLLVVGDGVDLPHLRQRAADLGDSAVFTGRVRPELAQTYVRSLDVFVVPRKDVAVCRKITPLKPAEAGGLGRAVVLSDLPALAEALPADSRRLVRPESAEELSGALIGLAEDPDERKRLGECARRWVEENRTWTSVGESYGRMYEEIGADVRMVSR